MKDTLSIEIPPNPKYTALVRLLASGIGRQLNLHEEEAEDLKLILTEACGLKSETEAGSTDLKIDITNDYMEIKVGPFSNSPSNSASEESRWSLDLISALADKVEFQPSNGQHPGELKIKKNLPPLTYPRV